MYRKLKENNFVLLPEKTGWKMPPKEVTDKYDVSKKEKLGQGTFGTVYKCMDRKSKKTVAVKKCHPVSEQERKMVEREIQTMLCIPDNPNIIKFLDSIETCDAVGGVNNLVFWIITELCDLGNLGKFMMQSRPNMDEKLLIMKQCVEGVKYLHQLDNPVIHRDIKPENILFKSAKGGTVTVKIADFGLAKVLTTSTQLRTIGGTALYMAPELVLEKKNYDFSVDIFSLGVVFLTILLFDKAQELIPISASAIRNKMIQSVATEMISAKLEDKPMPDIAPQTDFDGYREHGAKKVINNMVVYEPEQRISLQEADNDISYIIPRNVSQNPLLKYTKSADRKRYQSFDGPSVLDCMLESQGAKTCLIDPHIQEKFTILFKSLHLDQTEQELSTAKYTYDLLNHARHGDLAELKSMKSGGLDMSLKDYDGRTALHLASVEGRLDCVKFLLEECQVPHSPWDRWRQTPVDEARSKLHTAVVNYIENYIQKHEEAVGNQIYTLLLASSKGDLTTLQRLQSEGVDMCLSDYDGRTALHLAAAEGHQACVAWLLETCRVPSCPKDRWEHTPLNEARDFERKQVVKYLEDFLCKTKRRDRT